MEKRYAIFKRETDSLYAQFGSTLGGNKHRWFRARASLVYDHNENIIGAIESIRDVTEMKNSENELKRRSAKLKEINTVLENTNIALKVLLKHRENDKREMEEKIVRNLRALVLPYMEELKDTNLDSIQESLVNIVKTHLEEITSSFLFKIENKHWGLTTRELQIATLVKDGYRTKDIAKILNIEMVTVNNHRNRIRQKMKLTGRKVNLRFHLIS